MKVNAIAIGILIILITSINTYGQDWGVGIRLGDPSGVTLKKYMEGSAFELSIGRTHLFANTDYYNEQFDDWYVDNKFNYTDFQYIGYDASTPIGIQFHYLIQKEISRIGDERVSGLEWYYGFGGQVGFRSYTYDYRYKLESTADWFYAIGDEVTDLDIGVDGVIGLEYTFKDAPISLFTDVTLFMEVFDNPFLFWFQGGVGGRYRF